jgi:hypothetical protein
MINIFLHPQACRKGKIIPIAYQEQKNGWGFSSVLAEYFFVKNIIRKRYADSSL